MRREEILRQRALWQGTTPLHQAAVQGINYAMQQLIDAGAEIDSQDFIGYTPLMNAIKAGKIAPIRQLIAAGSNVNIQAIRGKTSLSLAISTHDPEIVRALIEGGANIHARNRAGRTPLTCVQTGIEMYQGSPRELNALTEIQQILLGAGAQA